MIVRVEAGWLVPIEGPVVRHGWIDVDTRQGSIHAVGGPDADPTSRPDRVVACPDHVVLPGLVNAHTHLELSHLAGRVPPAPDFVRWVRTLLAARGASPATDVPHGIVASIDAMTTTGTVAVGDIGNTDAAIAPLAASTLRAVHFREALGLRAGGAAEVLARTVEAVDRARQAQADASPSNVTVSVAPHAPYSTAPTLIAGLVQAAASRSAPSSIHLAESPAELEFLASGQGDFRALTEDLGAWDGSWEPPGLSPLAYLESLGALAPGLLVVHGTHLSAAELGRLATAGATLVLCVRSNRWVGAGVPSVEQAWRAGVPLAIGTDSLASVEDLNLFAELAAVRRAAPDVPAPVLLRAATRGGAQALGVHDLGVLTPGARSRVLIRRPPPDVEDVEEWLVASAADTTDLRWLDEVL